jgi:hypothetical protein
MEHDLFADLIVKDLAYSYQPDFPSAESYSSFRRCALLVRSLARLFE